MCAASVHVSRGFVVGLVWVLVAVLSPSLAVAASDADRHWTYIEQIENDGRSELAVEEIQRFVSEFPEDPRTPSALLRLASLQRSEGRPLAAVDAWTVLLDDHPRSEHAPRAALELATTLVAVGRTPEASDAYRHLIREYPHHELAERAALRLARLLQDRGSHDEARRILGRLVGTRASDEVAAWALLELARIELATGDRTSAIEGFDAVHGRHPRSEAGAEALFEAASLLQRRGARAEARRRYQELLDHYGDLETRANAHIRLARLLADSDPDRAVQAYREATDESSDPKTRETAWRRVVRIALAASRFDETLEAAATYEELFPASDHIERVRLWSALAAHRDGRRGAKEALTDAARSLDSGIAYTALTTLGVDAEEDGRLDRAMDLYRDAERRAPGTRKRVDALLAQARLSVERDRSRLGAELALTAHDIADDPGRRAQALLLATRAAVADGNRDQALSLGRRILREHPLTPEATRARRAIRRIERQRLLDPRVAARMLAELAEHSIIDPARRSYELALIHRDRLGDVDAALELLEDAIDQAGHPEQRGRLELEYGRTLHLRAFLEGARSDVHAARETLDEARRSLADAAVRAGRERSAQHARILLVAMELADRVQPRAPWAFDGWTMPVLGAVGDAEQVDVNAAELDTVRSLLREARRYADTDDQRAWVRWRQAELSPAPVPRRIEWARSALDAGPSKDLEWSIRNTLGQLLIRSGDSVLGVRQLTRVIRGGVTGEVTMSARFALAEARRREGRFDEARRAYEAVATVYPDTRRGRYALLRAGDCAAYAGDVAGAADRYRQLIDEGPTSIYRDDAWYRLGVVLARNGRTDAARDPLERLVESRPRSRFSGRAHRTLAEIAASRGRHAEAIAHAERWIETDVREAARADAWLHVARWHRERNEPDATLLWLDRRLRYRSPEPSSLVLRVEALSDVSDVHGATAILRRLKAGFPDSTAAITVSRLRIAATRRAAHEYEAALDLVRRAGDAAPTAALRARAAYEEGLTRAALGQDRRASEAWWRAAELDPVGTWAARALRRQGAGAMRRGDYREARRAHATFVARFPEDPRAARAMLDEGRALRALGRHDEALGRYQQLIERYPVHQVSDEALLAIARCHLELGQAGTALATFRRVAPHLDEDDAVRAHQVMARGLERLGRYEAAASIHARLAELAPEGSSERREALRRLDAASEGVPARR